MGTELTASWAEGPIPWRRVSWMPGAEGAELLEVVWAKVWGAEEAGTMRMEDYDDGQLEKPRSNGGGRRRMKRTMIVMGGNGFLPERDDL